MTGEQLAFDIDAILHQDAVAAAPAWTGAPLHFTSTYFSPSELDAAYAHWQFLHKLDARWTPNRMWHRAIAVPGHTEIGEHAFDMFAADLRCEPNAHGGRSAMCECVGDLTYAAVCEPHGWHEIADDENDAVESWHDHAFPTWRDLPIVPAHLRSVDQPGLSKVARKWIEEHYPPAMQVAGAPVITERSNAGTRHVPGRSPWSGYDISGTAIRPAIGLGD